MEVRGELFARRVALNSDTGEFFPIVQHQLWNLSNSAGGVNISEGAIVTIPNVTSPEMQVFPGEFLWVGGHLAEDDEFPNADDNLGFVDKKIPFANIVPGPQVVSYQESDQKVEARFMINAVEDVP